MMELSRRYDFFTADQQQAHVPHWPCGGFRHHADTQQARRTPSDVARHLYLGGSIGNQVDDRCITDTIRPVVITNPSFIHHSSGVCSGASHCDGITLRCYFD
jgi:hypothetical protein